ncbi:MAG: hypothetical protein JWP06_927 [Candidatus Saccharibacteria bacterium]|nr:hypothetical protein [Candidatus Saccharibacteria bacterium]
MEQLTLEDTVSSQFKTLEELNKSIVTSFVPSDAKEQKRAFLKGQIVNPDHDYSKLDNRDYDETAEAIQVAGEVILTNPLLNPKFKTEYEQFIDRYQKNNRLMQLAREYNAAFDPIERDEIRREYMRLNIELFGEPDEGIYRSLLQDKLQAIAGKELTGRALELRNELFERVQIDDSVEAIERFKPSDETVEWMHGVAETMYSGMLSHVPDGESFTEREVQEIFEAIIKEEFEESADSWTVTIEPAKSINVKVDKKRVVIPDDRGNIDRKTVRELIVHELGVHMLRSIIGDETDLELLKNGLNGFADAEEGLGKIMEQALNGTFVEAGVGHYITAGLAYHDSKDFREIYEINWRLAALEGVNEDGDITSETIEEKQDNAYGATMRIMRGTDELPLFKDLSYYNGSIAMWRFLESIIGDDVKFMFVFMGRGDPSNIKHQRVQYETATV